MIKKLKIGGQDYTIKEVSSASLEGDFGRVLPESLIIEINEDLPITLKQETLLHEIIHTINAEIDETTTQFLAHTLFQVLHDNNHLNETKEKTD